jgi:electron transfer flavoprotein alpha subunit
MPSVCIIAEHQKGKLKKSTLNAISFGREIAQKFNSDLCLIVIGNVISAVAEELKKYGAAKIFIIENPALENYTAETWSAAAATAAQKADATIVGMASGTTGKDMMPRLAVKLSAGMASDVVGFEGGNFLRGMWAGNVLAAVDIKTAVKVMTIQPTAFGTAEASGCDAPIEKIEFTIPQSKIRFVQMRETISARPDPTEARIVVSGGRGVNGKENFKILEVLADFLGGAVGASRAAVDAGWMPNDLQIGQTGKIVAPDMYVAVGLSGSIQHQAGMKNSKIIVAINKDEEAPIFQISDYGLVADLFKAVPELTEALKKELG